MASGKQRSAALFACLGWATVAAPALAQSVEEVEASETSPRQDLAEQGIAIRADVTGFAMKQLAGDGREDTVVNGRADLFVDFDTEKLGLWDGGGLHTHGEIRFGDRGGQFGGALWPANTGAVLPLTGNEQFEVTSIYLSQRIGVRTSLLVGKINAVDLLAADPFFGGWGTKRFQNIAFVAPPSGVVPPTIMGAVVVHKSNPITLTFMAFDPNDRTGDYWVDGLFADGVNLSVAPSWSGTVGGRPTSIGVTATVSTKTGVDLEDLLLPPGLVGGTRKGSYNIALQVSHLLVEGNKPGKGLGVYLKTAIADGNPNVIQSSIVGGFAGHALIGSRPDDSFGIGGYWYNFSNALQDSVSPVANFNDEFGVEAWYSLALTKWAKVSGDLQILDPATGDNDVAIIGGVRLNIGF